MTILGLDFGAKTIGVAVSDELLVAAHPVETIWREKEDKVRKSLARIDEIIKEKNVGTIVLGLPLMLDDSIGERAEKTLAFKEKLEKRTGLEVIMVDERFTTNASSEELETMGIKKSQQKTYIDQLAACLILEDYMNTLKDNKKHGR